MKKVLCPSSSNIIWIIKATSNCILPIIQNFSYPRGNALPHGCSYFMTGLYLFGSSGHHDWLQRWRPSSCSSSGDAKLIIQNGLFVRPGLRYTWNDNLRRSNKTAAIAINAQMTSAFSEKLQTRIEFHSHLKWMRHLVRMSKSVMFCGLILLIKYDNKTEQPLPSCMSKHCRVSAVFDNALRQWRSLTFLTGGV